MNKTTMNLQFVKRKQQVLTIFLASFRESVLIWFLNHCRVYLICQLKTKYLPMSGKAQKLLHSTRMKENVQIWPIIAWYQSSQWLGKNWPEPELGWWFLKRLLQASLQLSTSETLSLVTILLCSCTCTASLELLCQCSLGKLQYGPLPEAAESKEPRCLYNNNIKLPC